MFEEIKESLGVNFWLKEIIECILSIIDVFFVLFGEFDELLVE